VAAVVAVTALLGAGAGAAVALIPGRAAPHRTWAQLTHAAGHAAGDGRYGGIPSWLPRARVPVNRVVTASATHRRLAIEGDTVRVLLSRGRVLATVVGPAVPHEGRFPVPSTTPCRFTMTFATPAGQVPLDASAFTITDEFGHLHHPRVTLLGGGTPPSHVTAGHRVLLSVSAVLPVGNGRLSWAPAGRRPLASWDFDVEID
jgi:hypothetical protein